MSKKNKKKGKHLRRRIKFAMLRHVLMPTLVPVLKLWAKSLRVTSNVEDVVSDLNDPEQPVVFAVLHGQSFCFLAQFLAHSQPVSVVTLVSPSRDGELMDYLIHRLGQYTVRGSSSKQGRQALLRLRQKLKENFAVLLAVDGPRGPRAQPNGGAIAVARSTKAKLWLITATAEPVKRLSTWDRFLIPAPFARVRLNFELFQDYAQDEPRGVIGQDRARLQKRIIERLVEFGEDIEDVKLLNPETDNAENNRG